MVAQTYDSLFARKLQERIEAERQRVMEEIEGGEAIKTLEIYRERVGYLRALRHLDDWCAEVERNLNRGN